MKLDMNDYGSIISSLTYIVDDEEGKITSLLYKNDLENIRISTYGIDNTNDEYRLKITDSDGVHYHNTFSLVKNKFKLIKTDNKLEVRDKNSGTINGEYYSLSFNINGKEYEMDFDINYITVFDKSARTCEVYGSNNGIINMNNLIESYIFTDTGFIYHLKDSDKISVIYNDKEIVFNITDDTKKNPIPYLSRNIRTAMYSDNASFIISYDYDGLVSSVKSPDYTNLLYRQESITDDETNVYRKASLYPLFYDFFDPLLIDEPFIYWALDYLEKEENITYYRHNIYKVDESNRNMLLTDINSCEFISKPILI